MTRRICFFPFSHVTGGQKETLSTFFPEFDILPEMILEKARPKAEEFLEWAKIHKGNEHNLKALMKDHPYFTSDTQVTSIKSQIKGEGGKSKYPVESDQDALERDVLFLAMAGLLDAQNEQIDAELFQVDKSKETLLSELRGIDTPLDEFRTRGDLIPRDEGEVMTRQRIKAWFNCMQGYSLLKEADESKCFFVTTSPAVFDYFETNCSDVANALDIDQIKVHENNCKEKIQWQNQLLEYLEDAVGQENKRGKELPETKDSCLISGRIKVGIFSGDMIDLFMTSPGRQVVVCLVNLK